MPWYVIFNDVFWLSVGGMIFGFLSALSKCKYKKCSCCGIIIDKNENRELPIINEDSSVITQENLISRNSSIQNPVL